MDSTRWHIFIFWQIHIFILLSVPDDCLDNQTLVSYMKYYVSWLQLLLSDKVVCWDVHFSLCFISLLIRWATRTRSDQVGGSCLTNGYEHLLFSPESGQCGWEHIIGVGTVMSLKHDRLLSLNDLSLLTCKGSWEQISYGASHPIHFWIYCMLQ